MVETLNLLDGYDLKAMGHNSPDYIHTLAEALKLALADRDRYYGDPDFAKIPTTELLSKDYAALRRTLIEKQHASLAQQPGDPSNMKAVLASVSENTGHAHRFPCSERANDTTCVNVIDKDGIFSAPRRAGRGCRRWWRATPVLMGQRLQSALTDPKVQTWLRPGGRALR